MNAYLDVTLYKMLLAVYGSQDNWLRITG